MKRHSRRQRWLAGILTLAIVASGTPRVLAQDAAQHGALRLAQAVRNAEFDALAARVGVPPDANEFRPLNVTPSSANPHYSLNQTATSYFDRFGRTTDKVDPDGRRVSFVFNTLGNLGKVIDRSTAPWQFAFDANGLPTSSTDPTGHPTSIAYTAQHLPATVTDGGGNTTTYTYDAADQLTTTTDPTGSVTYAYDAAGRQLSMTDASGTSNTSYDAAGRTTSVAAPQGTVGYGYDDAGRRTSMTLPGSQTVAYAYDAAGRLTSATDPYARVTTYSYDVNNQRTSIARPNGVTSTYGYNAAGRLTTIDHAGTDVGSLGSFVYTYDAANNRTAVTSAAGTETYTLDALNRVTSVGYTNGDTVGYRYDANGNRLTQVVNGSTTATYSYDANGNLTAAGADSFTWDWADRMVSATVGGATTDYAYDGDGTRVATTSGGTTTPYVWDRAGGLAQLASDGTTTYMQAGGATEELDVTGTPTYTLADALGSTRGVTDGAGALIGTADYDAFGTVRGSTGASSQLGYTGEQHDAEAGFTYLRARYADPTTGRFLSADSVQPNAQGTQGFNAYAYVANNPSTWVDPSGHFPQGFAPALRDNWFPIALALGEAFAESSCAAVPVCLGLTILIIVIFIVGACVLDQQGPCWQLVHSGSGTRDQAQTKAADKAIEDVGPDVARPPMPTPPSNPNCIDNPVPWGGPAPQGRSDIPNVSNARLRNIINDLFRPDPQLTSGGTAGAIREELRTGLATGGKFHSEKGRIYVQELSKLLKTGQLSGLEKQIAEWLENDLLNALFGC